MKDTRKKRSDQSEMGLILENLTQRGAREVILMVVAHRRLPHWRHRCLPGSQQPHTFEANDAVQKPLSE